MAMGDRRRELSGKSAVPSGNRRVLVGANNLATKYPKVAAEWHPAKNNGLLPSQVAAGSGRKVWWLCSQGHEWEVAVDKRTCQGRGCPVCAGKRVLAGFNDLATKYPKVAAEWHPAKNKGLLSSQVAAATHRKIWWLCPEGHKWEAAVNSRTSGGAGCPSCALAKARRPGTPHIGA